MLKRKWMVNAISEATRLVIYGLGLSTLDAELGQIVASGSTEAPSRKSLSSILITLR